MFHSLLNLFRFMIPNGMVGNSTRGKQDALLRMLSIAHSQRLDPKILIQNLAAEHPGRYGRRLMLLQRWVAADSSLGAALAHTPGALDEDDTLAIQCGIETQTLDETFAYLLDSGDSNDQHDTGNIIRGAFGYILAVLFFAILVATFLMTFIVPVFTQIFDEFEMSLPAMMSALIQFSDYFSTILPLVLLVILGVGFLLLFEDVRRSLHRSVLGKLLPNSATRRSAGLLRLLALPTAVGKPLAPTLTAAALYHPDRGYRSRLLQARTDARDDRDVWRQLASQGLVGKTQGEELAKIDSASLRAWTLRTLANRQRRLASQSDELLARVLQYVPIVCLGLFVGWIAIAIMQTLTHLVRSLA